MDKWALEMRIATTPEERAKVWAARPDAATFARQMWDAIGSSLDQEWTWNPPPGSCAPPPSLTTTDADRVHRARLRQGKRRHPQGGRDPSPEKPQAHPHVLRARRRPNPRSLNLLEKIQATHPDPKTQGVAALAAALQLKTLGDDGEIMRKRLTYLRKAIIQSSEVDLDGVTVAKLAEDELYIIRFLTKGRTAPDLVGVDSANRPLSLDANKGKVIVLLFWNSTMQEGNRVVEVTNKLVENSKAARSPSSA